MYKEGQTTLCQMHNEIRYLSEQVKKDLRVGDVASARDKLTEIKKLTKEAKKAGQHMENRLTQYRRGVEALGFKRI